jgi:hypothetical protein
MSGSAHDDGSQPRDEGVLATGVRTGEKEIVVFQPQLHELGVVGRVAE